MTIDPNKQIPGGPDTFNEVFFDALVRHQIGLLRLSGSVRNQIFELLDATEEDIASLIRRRLANNTGLDSPASIKRLQALLLAVTNIRAKAWDEVDAVWVQEAIDLAKTEPGLTQSLFRASYPVQLETVLPSVGLLTQIAVSEPFEGKNLKQWAKDVRRADLARIESSIKIGMVQGESSQVIARRVVGTVRLRGRDGVTQITRNNAAAITRTAINHIGNRTRQEYYLVNGDVFDKELYVATLDGRTTFLCKSLDGRTWPVGEGYIPPVHMNCRSIRVAVVDGNVIGSRPARSFTQKGLLKEFSEREGFATVTKRDALPHGTKGTFDAFSRRRMRELTGTVPAKVTYQVWLGRQSAAFQNDTLGPTRGRLFRRGDLQLDRFVNRAGDEIPLSQLARTDKDAFIKAGLDPEDFL